MDLKQLFEKIYNGEITKNDVIVCHIKDYPDEYEQYILNDEFDFWDMDGDGVLSLSFFTNKDNENYSQTFSIISRQELEERIESINKNKRIRELEKKLKELKGE